MPNPPIDHNESSEVVFDIINPVEGIKFLGLLDHSGEPGNRLTGLFDWQCQRCGSLNRDAVIVDPEQAFISRWLCRHCEKAMIVRFRARGSIEWVAEHTLAITGKALCHLTEEEFAADAAAIEHSVRRRASQRLFAWIAVPALIALVLLGLSDMQPLSDALASPTKSERGLHQSGALSRLPGQWVSEDGKDRLYFGHIDAVSRRGTYVRFFQDRRPGDLFWFDVIHEDPREEKLVIRLCEGQRLPRDGKFGADLIYSSTGRVLDMDRHRGRKTCPERLSSRRRCACSYQPPELKFFKN